MTFRTHLLSSEYNYHVYVNAAALAYSFHELGDEASLSELRLVI